MLVLFGTVGHDSFLQCRVSKVYEGGKVYKAPLGYAEKKACQTVSDWSIINKE